MKISDRAVNEMRVVAEPGDDERRAPESCNLAIQKSGRDDNAGAYPDRGAIFAFEEVALFLRSEPGRFSNQPGARSLERRRFENQLNDRFGQNCQGENLDDQF